MTRHDPDSSEFGKRSSKGRFFAWGDSTLSSDSTTNYTLTLERPKQDSKKVRRGGGGSREEHQRSRPFRAHSSRMIFGNALTKSRSMTLNDGRPSNFTIVLYDDDENTDTSISLKEPIFNYNNMSSNNNISSSDSGSGRNTSPTEAETEQVQVHSREHRCATDAARVSIATSVVSSNSSDYDDDDLSSSASGKQEQEEEEEDEEEDHAPLCW